MSSAQVTEINDIDAYLEQHQRKELLRFVAVGSVDDGKSTLIGRLLHDTKGVYEDQLSAVKKATQQADMEIDFSLFTDGLKAEREQGITIDVAYRYFSTDQRKFIIADTPGHVQYTRNMATGASTADVAIILIDARLGVIQQSRRHAYIASLLGIPHLLVAVNKMDLRNYSQAVFDDIVSDFRSFAKKLSFKDVTFVPISAKLGDNVVHSSTKTPWYKGGTLLEFLEQVPIDQDRNADHFRFPVQSVIRPNLNYRGFAGEVASGVVKKGDEVVALPSQTKAVVTAIDTFESELDSAGPGTAVSLRLDREIDISRGDMLTLANEQPLIGRRFDADVVWMSEKLLDPGKSYLLKHTTQMVRVNVEEVTSVTDLETLSENKAETLQLNDIGQLRLACHKPLFFDAYRSNRVTGAFILIDSISNDTVAAGMILGAARTRSLPPPGSEEPSGADGGSQVSATERAERLGQIGAAILLSGEAATAAAFAVERHLFDNNRIAAVLAPEDAASRLGAGGMAAGALRLANLGILAICTATSGTEKAQLVAQLGESRVLSANQDGSGWLLASSGDSGAIDAEGLAKRILETLDQRDLLLQ